MSLKNPSVFRGAVLFSVFIITLVAEPFSAFSHGFAGDRFFPATISTDDPFAASELSLPTFSEIRQPGPPPLKVFDISTDLSVTICNHRNTRVRHSVEFGYPKQPQSQHAAMGLSTRVQFDLSATARQRYRLKGAIRPPDPAR